MDAANFVFAAADSSRSPALTAAFTRFKAIYFTHRVSALDCTDGDTASPAPLQKMKVSVGNSDARLAFGVDESYTLIIPADDAGEVTIEAATLFGA